MTSTPQSVAHQHSTPQQQASDPKTDPGVLAQLAQNYPELRPSIATNPATYQGLLDWLRDFGDSDVAAALKRREEQPAAAETVANPATDAATLATLAYDHPHLRATIANHPNSYDELRAWIAAAGMTEPDPPAREVTVNGSVPAAQVAPLPGLNVSLGATAVAGSSIYKATLITYLLGMVAGWLPLVISESFNNFAGYANGRYFESILVGIAGLMVASAGFNSPPGRRAGAGVLGIAAVLSIIAPYVLFGPYWYLGDLAAIIIETLPGILIFLSWAVGRPLRGLAYLALPIGIVLNVAVMFVSASGLFGLWYLNWFAYSFVFFALRVAIVVVCVRLALAFDSASRSRSVAVATMPASPYASAAVAPTNGFAIASLVLGLVGGSIIGVIFGHIALSQINRTGQGGRGMATAGLVLNYAWFAALAIYLIWLFSALSRFL